jgi:hypothetical protein
MRHSQLQEELSAYLDGEAEDPQAVRRLIEEDPDAARLYSEMKRLSTRLGALPEPKVPAQFLTRVMADVRDEDAPRRFHAWRFTATVAGMAAMAAIVLSVVLYRAEPDGGGPEDPWARTGANGSLQDADAWMLANQGLFDEEWDQAAGLEAYAVASADALTRRWEAQVPRLEAYAVASADALLGALAAEEWFPSFAWSVESKDDIDTLLGSLTDEESETLKKLLLEYAEEELST